MTTQELDSCEFQGDEWWLIEWRPREGSPSPVPTNEWLGIAPEWTRTSNYRGRTDFYAVRDGQLFLDRVAASLAKPERGNLPPHAVRAQRGRLGDTEFTFENFAIAFSGELELGTDLDENLAQLGTICFRTRAILAFENGRLSSCHFEKAESPEPPSNLV